MAPSPSQVLNAIKASGVRYSLCDKWDDSSIDASGTWDPSYVILHHTANGGATGNAPSLNYCLKGSYPPIRNCHFLIGRDGLVYVLTTYQCYHAGEGGPGKWGDGPQISANSMNHYAYGIEIESKGTSTNTSGSNGTDGITNAQVEATAALTAALLDLINQNVGCAINHKTWAPGRKTDTVYADSWWHDRIDEGGDMALSEDDIRKVAEMVWAWKTTDPVSGDEVSERTLLNRIRQDADAAEKDTKALLARPPGSGGGLTDHQHEPGGVIP